MARKGGAPSQRQLRVGENIRHGLSELLTRREFNIPELDGIIITVTEVQMSPDMKVAHCYVSPMAGDGIDTSGAVQDLNRHAGFFRKEISRQVHLKFAPEIRFNAETSFDRASHVQDILDSDAVRRDIE